MTRKRIVAVVTFDDTEDDIMDLSAAATWVEAALSRSMEDVDVTAYATANAAAFAEADRVGDFSTPAQRVPMPPEAA